MQIANGMNTQVSNQNSQVELNVLKKSQDIAEKQAQDLIQAIPKSPSPQGVGQGVDLRV